MKQFAVMNSRMLSAASMCRAVFRLAFLALLILTIQPIGYANAVSDSDWNISFYDNCGMPSRNSTQWLKEDGNRFIRFTLNDKDKGNCSTDGFSRDGAPYWERAELKQSNRLYFNKKYELTFQARFIEGFLGDKENFFQIHAHDPSCRQARPPVMLKFQRGSLLLAISHKSVRYKKSSNHYSSTPIEDLIGKWTKFKLVFDTSKSPKISVYLNEKKISEHVGMYIHPCGAPHFKFGLYRPGNRYHPVARSVVDFDKFQLKVLDKDFRRPVTAERELNYCFYGGVEKNGRYERQIKLADLWLDDPGPDMKIYAVTPPNKCEEGHEEIAEGQYIDMKARWGHKSFLTPLSKSD